MHKYQSLSYVQSSYDRVKRKVLGVCVSTMDIDKTTCWLFIFFRSTFILLGLHAPAKTHPLPLYLWKDSSRRQIVRSASEATLAIPINYRLDAWSQYDNPEEGNAREGDIRDQPIFRKTTTTDQQLLWPDGLVRYYIDETIVDEPEKVAILEDVMDNIMELTCIKFIRIHPDAKGKFPAHTWLNITGYEQGCFSDLGRSTFGPSNLNLDVKRCFRKRGHALHEIFHTLGVFHEHMRPDRDEYIKILWENIKEGDAFNFRIMDKNAVTTYGLPYDYDSIMHYSMTAFSKNKSIPTIVPRKDGVEIGQRSHLSFNDVKKLLITYKCNDVDTEYLYNKINQDYDNDDEILNLNSTNSSGASVESTTKNLGSSVKALRDYQPLYEKTTHRTSIPINKQVSYEFSYPEYFPNPSMTDYYYYYYCHYV